MGDQSAWGFHAGFSWCAWFGGFKPCFELVFQIPFSELSLVEVEPVLLGTDDHAWSHESHKGDDFVGGEAVAVDEVCADQTARSTKTGFAVDGDALFSGDLVMG